MPADGSPPPVAAAATATDAGPDVEVVAPAPAARRRTWWVLAVWGVLAVAFAAALWSRRWISDDGFINFRIVENVLDGHGPVFNPGERVEAGTSQLWLLLLVVAELLVGWAVELEWLAVVIGFACSLGAVAVATFGHWRSWAAPVLPAAALAWLAVPAVWDFSSSGLEGPLLWLWLAGCFSALVVRAGREPTDPASPWWLPVLIGLGPLIRPDGAVYAAAFGAALVLLSTRRWQGLVRAAALALALPVLYQVFRAGFFGVLLPNTALAKEAGSAQWASGGRYLSDFVRIEALWIPAAAVAALAVVVLASGAVGRRRGLVWGLTAAAGLVHALWVVRVGGDFMHARLFLPDWFCLALPIFALPAVQLRRPAVGALTLVLAVWAGWAAVSVRAPFQSPVAPGVVDERTNYVTAAGTPHPVTLDDHGSNVWTRWGREAAARAADGDDVVLWAAWDRPLRATPSSGGTYLVWPNIGMLGYAAGPDVHVVDAYGLADPIAARLTASGAGRAGHAKALPPAWVEARFAGPGAEVSPDAGAASDALACPPVQELLDAVDNPLTPRRFVANLVRSPSLTRLRIPEDPVEAVEQLC